MIVLLFPVELCAFCLLIFVRTLSYKKGTSEICVAVKANATPDNVDALGEWFEQYGDRYWNGEFFDADGLRLFPVYVEVDEDQFEITGYEVR